MVSKTRDNSYAVRVNCNLFRNAEGNEVVNVSEDEAWEQFRRARNRHPHLIVCLWKRGIIVARMMPLLA